MDIWSLSDSSSYLEECLQYLAGASGSITRCLDRSLFLEAAITYARAKHIYYSLKKNLTSDHKREILEKVWEEFFEGKQSDISDRSRKWLSAIQIVDNLNSVNLLSLFLESRKSFVSRILSSGLNASVDQVTSVFCKVFEIIQLTLLMGASVYAYTIHIHMQIPYQIPFV